MFSWNSTNTYFTFCRSRAIFCCVVSTVAAAGSRAWAAPAEVVVVASVIAGSTGAAAQAGTIVTAWKSDAAATHAVEAFRKDRFIA